MTPENDFYFIGNDIKTKKACFRKVLSDELLHSLPIFVCLIFRFMEIRKTKPEEIHILMDIFALAKAFMKKSGNLNQWNDGYPSRELIMQNIQKEFSYVCMDDDHEIVATFYFEIGIDPNYAKIYDGEWLNDEPYGVIHRMASTGKVKGISDYCLQWCFDQCKNIRIDTHRDNLTMQNAVRRNGYTYCGIIHLQNGAERLAFQKHEK